LVFQDEVEIHRHPTLARMWGPVGTQPRVPAPGQNEKQVVYGGVDYVTGKITFTIAGSKSGVNFLAFLIALATAYAGRKVRLVCDNGRFHHTKAVHAWLEANSDLIEVFWLPPYCPDLNLIERLWGHLKRTVLANVLFDNMDDLVLFHYSTEHHAALLHYHRERNHQGLENRLLVYHDEPKDSGPIECHQRLGGLLKFYCIRNSCTVATTPLLKRKLFDPSILLWPSEQIFQRTNSNSGSAPVVSAAQRMMPSEFRGTLP